MTRQPALARHKKSQSIKTEKKLENLAFGNALVITKGNKNVLITDTEEFVIPDDFSLASWDELKNMLWKMKLVIPNCNVIVCCSV